MNDGKAKTITQRYRFGRIVTEAPRMREAKFRRYMAGLAVRLGQFDGGRLGLALTMTVLGLGLTTVLFLMYLLVFVLIPKLPVLPGLVASLVVGLGVAGALFALSLSARGDRRHQSDEVIEDPGLAGKLEETLSPYADDRVLGALVADAIGQVGYADRRKAEIGEANERVNAGDARARERIDAVASLGHKAARAHVMESVGKMGEYLERRRGMGLADLELEYEAAYADLPYGEGDEGEGDDGSDGDISREEEELVRSLRRQGWEWRMRRRLTPISAPLRDNYEFVLAEMDYVLLTLEIAGRGLAVGPDGLVLSGAGEDGTAGEEGRAEELEASLGEVAEIAGRLARERRETFSYDGSVESPDMLAAMAEARCGDGRPKAKGGPSEKPGQETASG